MYVSAGLFDGASLSVSQQRQRAVGRVVFSAASLNGRTRPTGEYVYHATDTFPYLLGCYRGTP